MPTKVPDQSDVKVNSRQRILRALDNQQPDRVPIFESWIDEPLVVEMAKGLGYETDRAATTGTLVWAEEDAEILDMYCFLVEELGLDSTSYDPSIGLERIDDQYGRDRYGRVYRLSEHGEPMVVDGPVKQASDARAYEMASRLRADDFASVKHVIDRVGRNKAHFMGLADPFKIGWLSRGGMETYLIDMMTDPGLVHRLARIATDYALAVVDMAAGLGVDVIFLNGDLAGEITTLIAPKHYREYVKPYHQEIVAHAHRRGLKVVKHSDGNVWPILDDFVEAGFDGIHPIQPQCMEIAAVKEHLAGRACILGNIDCRDLLPFGSEEEVEEAVRETIQAAAPDGGYIISSSNSIHPGCKASNYIAMVKAAHRYGVYDVP